MPNKKVIRVVIKIVLACGILTVLFAFIPVRDVIKVCKSANLRYVMLGYCITVLLRFLEACQIKVLAAAHKMKLSMYTIFEIGLTSTFYNLFLPGYIAGGVIRWYRFSKEEQKPAEAFSVIALNRFMRLYSILLVGTFFLCLYQTGIAPRVRNVFVFITIGYTAMYIALIYFPIKHISGLFGRIIRVPTVLASKLMALRDAFEYFRTMSVLQQLWLFVMSIGIQLVGICSFVLFARAVAISIPYITLAWVRAIVFMISALPISFSGIGVRESALLFFLRPMGVAPEICVGLSFILLSRILLLAFIGGILEIKNIMFYRQKETVK